MTFLALVQANHVSIDLASECLDVFCIASNAIMSEQKTDKKTDIWLNDLKDPYTQIFGLAEPYQYVFLILENQGGK